ncbi:hypothetical protein [Massilia sp. PWRC2]|uniref:hypothetical protein n=1 Tax=Massilia sp. PWRC2 TaxID=2804626 RepID=UPI003CEED095
MRLALLWLAVPACSAHAFEPKFEQIFNTKGEPAATHFKATFVANGAEHQLEVWREANRIRRLTDGSAEVFAVRKTGSDGYRLSVLDLKKKIHTDIDRDNLYRMGNFTDWFDLGHGLRHPKGPYHLSAATAPTGAATPVAPCSWIDLEQQGRVTHVCWSAKSRLPLLMQADDGRTIWRLSSVDHKPLAAATFVIDDAGFVRNDANRDMAQD